MASTSSRWVRIKRRAECFVGVFGEALLAVGQIVVARVLERVEARIAQRNGAAFERAGFAAKR